MSDEQQFEDGNISAVVRVGDTVRRASGLLDTIERRQQVLHDTLVE